MGNQTSSRVQTSLAELCPRQDRETRNRRTNLHDQRATVGRDFSTKFGAQRPRTPLHEAFTTRCQSSHTVDKVTLGADQRLNGTLVVLNLRDATTRSTLFAVRLLHGAQRRPTVQSTHHVGAEGATVP